MLPSYGGKTTDRVATQFPHQSPHRCNHLADDFTPAANQRGTVRCPWIVLARIIFFYSNSIQTDRHKLDHAGREPHGVKIPGHGMCPHPGKCDYLPGFVNL